MAGLKFKEVTPEVKARLDLGDAVIAQVKRLAPWGSGNQKHVVEKTHGRSAYLTGLVQRRLGDDDWERPLRNAGVTAGYGAGACQNLASLSYTVLRSRLSAADTICLCAHLEVTHWCATIGDPDQDPANEVVVVDPWPISPQACVLEDHFCGDALEVVRRKHAGKPNLARRLRKHKPPDGQTKRAYARRNWFTYDFNEYPSDWWNQVYCSKYDCRVIYQTRMP